MGHITKTSTLAVAMLGAGVAHAGSVTIDGKYDVNEGYTHRFTLERSDVKDGESTDPGTLWAYQDSITGDLSLAFILPKTYVDNSYGVNAIGWGDKGHTLKDLIGSDSASFLFTYNGDDLLELDMDYISVNKDTGMFWSGMKQKDLDKLEPNTLLGAKTSMEYNANLAGAESYVTGDDPDSPETDENYSANSLMPDWQFEAVYEFRVGGSVFDNKQVLDNSGFINGYGLVVESLHASPNKGGAFEDITPYNPTAVPTPTAAFAGIGGLIALSMRRRRRAAA